MPQACRDGSAQPTTEGVAIPHPCWPSHAPDPLPISPRHESSAASGEEAAITSGPGRTPQMLVYPNPPSRARVTTASPTPYPPAQPRASGPARHVPCMLPLPALAAPPLLKVPLVRSLSFTFPPPLWVPRPCSPTIHQPLVPLPAQSWGSPWPQRPVSGHAETILRSEMGWDGPV